MPISAPVHIIHCFSYIFKVKIWNENYTRMNPSTHAPGLETVLLSYTAKFVTLFKFCFFSYCIISWNNSVQKFAFECMQCNHATFFLDCTLCVDFVYHVSDPHQSAACTYILSLSYIEIQGSITLHCFWKNFISLLELQPTAWSDGWKEVVKTNFLYSDKP